MGTLICQSYMILIKSYLHLNYPHGQNHADVLNFEAILPAINVMICIKTLVLRDIFSIIF